MYALLLYCLILIQYIKAATDCQIDNCNECENNNTICETCSVNHIKDTTNTKCIIVLEIVSGVYSILPRTTKSKSYNIVSE